MKIDQIRVDYENQKPRAFRFMNSLIEQLQDLLEKHQVTLGTPIERRIKTISSIEEKLERKEKSITSVAELDDFVGVRIIVLFRSDIEKVCSLIKKSFDIADEENVSDRLKDDKFGYQSTHYTIQLPSTWLSFPTLSDLAGLKAEVQIRTLSQHIWAVASHKLQYKRESNVPLPLRRTINRVSALLETVDLEFDRVLSERQDYKNTELQNIHDDSSINVDVLEKLCDELLPIENKYFGHENYSEILSEMQLNDINTVSQFSALIENHLVGVLQEDKDRAADDEIFDPDEIARAKIGVYFTHVGLVRGCLQKERRDEYVHFDSSMD